jgi:hypothetical protein
MYPHTKARIVDRAPASAGVAGMLKTQMMRVASAAPRAAAVTFG